MEADSSGLDYDNARYYDPAIGRFISEDSAFLALGDPEQLKSIVGQELNQFLLDPQNFNSYSYVKNNPLKYTDPTGQFAFLAIPFIGEAFAAISTAAILYGPQIMSYANSFLSPLGQMGVNDSIDNMKSGHPVVAIVGGLTAGDLPEGKVNSKALNTINSNVRKICNNIQDHLTPSDLQGFIKDLSGNPVWNYAEDRAFMHENEVMNAKRGLENSIKSLNNVLKNNKLDTQTREIVNQTMQKAQQNVNKVDNILKSFNK